MDEVSAMKFLIMSLVHCNHVFFSSENLNLQNKSRQDFDSICHHTILISHVRTTSDKASLSFDCHQSSEFSIQVDCLVTVSVSEYYVWDPQLVHLIQSVKISFGY